MSPSIANATLLYLLLMATLLAVFNARCCLETFVFLSKALWRGGQAVVSLVEARVRPPQ